MWRYEEVCVRSSKYVFEAGTLVLTTGLKT